MDRDQEYTAFVLARSAQLMRVAHALCGDPDLAEDLTQTALVRAYLKWDRIEFGDPFWYVRKAIVNEYRSRLRRRPWRERSSGGATELETVAGRHGSAASGDPFAGVDRQQALITALASLTWRERATIVLRYLEDLSETETATVLDVAVGTVKSTTARALAKLRRSELLAGAHTGGGRA